nr:hypothetical protein [Candidatus Njordarchaeota archaeon]
MENKTDREGRVFSVGLKSMRNLKNVSLTEGSNDGVLVEGTIGELVQATFKEGIVLEVIGRDGTLRLDLAENEIQKPTEQNASEGAAHD